MEKPRLQLCVCVCVCQLVFLVEWQYEKQQRGMVLILLLTPLQPAISWFENARDLGQTHAHSRRRKHTRTHAYE